MFNFSSSPLPVRSDLTSVFRAVWEGTAKPGTWWEGTERVAIASTARAAYAGKDPESSVLSPAAIEAANVLGRKPSAVTQEMIAGWEADGLTPDRYIELIGIVSRVIAIDTFHRGLEIDLEPLPNAESGTPTGAVPQPAATRTKAWVPMVGPPTIPTSLSAVPAEMDALEPLHGPMYLTYEQMGNPNIQRGLHRSQMELVASRTSAINECFF